MAKRIISTLSHIEVETSDPFKLLLQWKNEAAASCISTNIMCLATSTKDGNVSNRNVMLQEIVDNGFVFVSKKTGRKIQDISDNPRAAATFLFFYTEAEQRSVSRQIRIEGTVTELERSICEKYFRNQPISGQIRDIICNQDEPVEWNDLKKKHDELLQKLQNEDIELEIPEEEAAWKIIPERFDFYYSLNGGIADRVVFTKDGTEKWKYVHVGA